MAVIDHAFRAITTADTTTSGTYSDVTNASIASDFTGADTSSGSGFTVGNQYLIRVTYQVDANTNDIICGVRVVHGSTAFADSVYEYPSSSTFYTPGSYTTVWTAVSGEGIKVQFNSSGTTEVVAIDQISIFVMDLDTDLTENTDWFYDDHTTDDAITTGATNGATVTFTPSGASDWLVITQVQIDPSAFDTEFTTELVRSGEASSTDPTCVILAGASTAIDQFQMSRVYALTASSNTFTERTTGSATGSTRLNSKVFALNLEKFKDHQSAYTAASQALNAGSYDTTPQTMSLTPTTASNVLIGAYFGFDNNDANREIEFRIQVEQADLPATQTSDNYNFRYSFLAIGIGPFTIDAFDDAMEASAHTIDLDAACDDVTGAPATVERALWAFTMELGPISITPTIGAATIAGTSSPLDLGLYPGTTVKS